MPRLSSSTTTLTVRDALPSDAAPVAELLGELGYRSSERQAALRLERLALDPAARVFVAESEGELAGLAGMRVEQLLEHDEPACRLLALVVGRAHRRKGVASELVRAVEREARACGCFAIVLTSADRRADAHAFYTSAGFEQTGQRFAKEL